jgi:nucleotide-binding universal stress UspA family protein
VTGMALLGRGAPPALPEPAELGARAVLLATEERAFTRETLDLAAAFGAPVHVIAVARVHGTNLGFPHPGLLPTKAEWETQRGHVDAAIKALRRRGLQTDGRVVGTRSATKKIVQEAARLGCDAIVMGADLPRSAFLADFMWSQEPYRVRRKARVPVYLVTHAD